MNLGTERFIATGYLLVREAERPSSSSPELLPDRILSASTCISPQFPGIYSFEWAAVSEEDRSAAFEKIGLPVDRRPAAVRWATDQFDRCIGWPGVFLQYSDAIAARDRFFPDIPAPSILGLGLPAGMVDDFIRASSPPSRSPGHSPMGESGFLIVAKRTETLAPGYRPLGFELLNVEAGQIGHSWLCNGLETHFSSALGIRPGQHGFIQTLDEAERCSANITDEGPGAEPGPWFPWLVVEYP
jgi:hypothetical protein